MDTLIKEMIEHGLNEGKVVRLFVKGREWSAVLGEDIEVLSRAELEGYHAELEERLGDMEDARPNDPTSEEFTVWADAYGDLKDLISEVEDRLDELG